MRHCKSSNCRRAHDASKTCTRNTCCSNGPNQWYNSRTTPNCTEYCTIIPAYTSPLLDLNCDKCYKVLPYSSPATYGCCPITNAAIECPEVANQAIYNNHSNSLCYPHRCDHSRSHPKPISKYDTLPKSNSVLTTIDRYKPLTSSANNEDHDLGYRSGGFTSYDFGPNQTSTSNSETPETELSDYALQFKDGPKSLSSPSNGHFSENELDTIDAIDSESTPSLSIDTLGVHDTINRISPEACTNSDSKILHGNSNYGDSLAKSQVRSSFSSSSSSSDGKLSIGNLMNLKIEIDSSLGKSCKLDSGHSNSDHLYDTDNTLNRTKLSTLNEINRTSQPQEEVNSNTTTTSVTTNVNSSTKELNICTITRTTTSTMSTATDQLSPNSTSSTIRSTVINGGKHSLKNSLAKDNNSITISDVRKKVAQAKAAFFHQTPTNVMLDAAIKQVNEIS